MTKKASLLAARDFADAFDTLPIGAALVRDGVCLYANAAWATMTQSEALGDGWRTVVPADVETLEVSLPPAVEGGEARWGRITLRPLAGGLRCVMLEDVTAAHLAHAIIQTQNEIMAAESDVEEVMRVVVERTQALTGADGGVVETVDGDCMVYRAASGTAAPYVGLRLPIATSLSGLCTRTGEVIRCDDSEHDPRVDKEACRRVGATSMIVVPLRQPGRVDGVLKVLSRRPYAFDEGHVRTLALMSGVIATSLSYAEELRMRTVAAQASQRAQQAAEHANRAKSDFLAAMSHEIRTPMNGVLGMAQIALDRPMDDVLRGYVKTIRSSGEALLTLVNDILDLSKIEADRLELEHVDFAVDDVLDGVRDTFAVRAADHGIGFEVTRADDVPCRLNGDPLRLRQILVNLVGNALKFTREGHVRVTVRCSADALVLEVDDTGIGIAPDKQQRIFDPFTQAEASTARHFGGSGLDWRSPSSWCASWAGPSRSKATLDGARHSASRSRSRKRPPRRPRRAPRCPWRCAP